MIHRKRIGSVDTVGAQFNAKDGRSDWRGQSLCPFARKQIDDHSEQHREEDRLQDKLFCLDVVGHEERVRVLLKETLAAVRHKRQREQHGHANRNQCPFHLAPRLNHKAPGYWKGNHAPGTQRLC
jgi:hypothetical protein